MPDNEAQSSSLAARYLGIELNQRAIEGLSYDPQWRSRQIRLPEPSGSIIAAHWTHGIVREQAQAAPVWFYGEGPDNAFHFDRDA